ncbi:MAG: YkgJ family cysteine cluster protein [Candidatus Omnitrophota bacterium]
MVRALWGWFKKVVGLSTGGSLTEKTRRLKGIYRSLDKETAAFKIASGLCCVNPCGQCCINSTVEATELEMLPMAAELIRSGAAEQAYQQAEDRHFEGRCVVYSSGDLYGKCLSYEQRPLVCRLFGFAGNRDKHGRPRLVTCGLIKHSQPQQVELVLGKVAQGGLNAPMMNDWVMRLSAVDPQMARESFPINTALKKALERIWLNRKYNQSN